MVANTKWDVKELGLEYNTYVDWIISEMETFGNKLSQETKDEIPPKILEKIWSQVICRVMESLVEGYSRVKKVTNTSSSYSSVPTKVE